MLLIATISAGVVAATPIGSWITYNDYPASALQRGEQGAAEFRAIIAPDGKPESCDVLSSTGNKQFDRLTCSLLMRRARFNSAMDEKGKPTHGVFHSINNFWQPDGSNSKFPVSLAPDLRLTVKALPSGMKSPVVIIVHMGVDERGAFKACTAPVTEQQQKACIDRLCTNPQWLGKCTGKERRRSCGSLCANSESQF